MSMDEEISMNSHVFLSAVAWETSQDAYFDGKWGILTFDFRNNRRIGNEIRKGIVTMVSKPYKHSIENYVPKNTKG